MEKNIGFTGHLGFVLSAAGCAVGIGNLWRFPYLAAKDGGGLFIAIYLLLVITFGITLLVTDIAIGRRTGKSSLAAFAVMHKKWKFLGVLIFFVLILMQTFYPVVGGWVTKYIIVYLLGTGRMATDDAYFSSFISDPTSVWYVLFFITATAVLVYRGVEKGIERCSRLIMPILLVIIVGICVFSLSLSQESPDGIVRTGMQGLAVYLIPDFENLTMERMLQVALDAMSQLFFSLSVSTGILITYGSYVKKSVNLTNAVVHIGLFDTLVSFLAGVMIIPAIFVFMGMDGMTAGPGLMFVSLPKVFNAMGDFGHIVGLAFFVMTWFAAITSCVSAHEAIIANFMDMMGATRECSCTVKKQATENKR